MVVSRFIRWSRQCSILRQHSTIFSTMAPMMMYTPMVLSSATRYMITPMTASTMKMMLSMFRSAKNGSSEAGLRCLLLRVGWSWLVMGSSMSRCFVYCARMPDPIWSKMSCTRSTVFTRNLPEILASFVRFLFNAFSSVIHSSALKRDPPLRCSSYQ